MVNLRHPFDPPVTPGEHSLDRGSRLNMLLTEDRPYPAEHWTVQLRRLLEPQGVTSYLARSGEEALELSTRYEIHAAIIDLATPQALDRPLRDTPRPDSELWLVELLRRLPSRPPVVIVRSPVLNQGQADRLLVQALRLGAFSVLNKPIALEAILSVFQKLVERRYHGAWPGTTND